MPAEELIAKWELGKDIVTAVENPTIFMKSSPFLGHISGIAFCIWNRKKLRKIFE